MSHLRLKAPRTRERLREIELTWDNFFPTLVLPLINCSQQKKNRVINKTDVVQMLAVKLVSLFLFTYFENN